MRQESIEHAFQVAEKRWNRKKHARRITTRVNLTGDKEDPTVNVIVYHHETFPSSGQTFTADLRRLPEAGQRATEGEFMARRRFHLI